MFHYLLIEKTHTTFQMSDFGDFELDDFNMDAKPSKKDNKMQDFGDLDDFNFDQPTKPTKQD